MLPVMNAASAVAAIELAAMNPPPANVTKMVLRLASNFATKEFVEVPLAARKAAPLVVVNAPEVVVPAT
jgi:hypothetical protein